MDFRGKRLEYYLTILNKENINFEIIDPNYEKINNYSDYMNNLKLKEIIDKLLDLDMNSISFRQSFEILSNVHEDLVKIYKN